MMSTRARGLFQTEGGKGRQHSSPRPLISRSSSSSDSHIKVTPSKDTCAQTPQASRGTHRKWGGGGDDRNQETIFSQDGI